MDWSDILLYNFACRSEPQGRCSKLQRKDGASRARLLGWRVCNDLGMSLLDRCQFVTWSSAMFWQRSFTPRLRCASTQEQWLESLTSK
eukprot:96706-Amphidinium_carterae.1